MLSKPMFAALRTGTSFSREDWEDICGPVSSTPKPLTLRKERVGQTGRGKGRRRGRVRGSENGLVRWGVRSDGEIGGRRDELSIFNWVTMLQEVEDS